MYDVIIIGARCAGSPLAMLLAQQGYRVLLLDRAKLPSDHIQSTHFVHQKGVHYLSKWGLRDKLVQQDTPPFEHMQISIGSYYLLGKTPGYQGEEFAFAPRRYVLDAILLEAAIQSGAELRDGCTLEELIIEDGRVVGIRARTESGTSFSEHAKIVVGADGSASRVAKLVGAEELDNRPPLMGAAWGYWEGFSINSAVLRLHDHGSVLMLPTNGSTIVGLNWAIAQFLEVRPNITEQYYSTIQQYEPDIAELISTGRLIDDNILLGSVRSIIRKAHGPGWALLGNAHYTKDPNTAQGITDAFVAAEELSQAIHLGLSGVKPLERALAEYEQHHVSNMKEFYEFSYENSRFPAVTDDVLAFFGAFEHNPTLLTQFLGQITQVVRPSEFMAIFQEKQNEKNELEIA